MLHDLLVEALQVVQVTGAIARQLFGTAQAVGDELHQQGYTEYQHSEQPRGEQRAEVQHADRDQS